MLTGLELVQKKKKLSRPGNDINKIAPRRGKSETLSGLKYADGEAIRSSNLLSERKMTKRVIK